MKPVADKLGMFMSGLCAIQCAMLPILLSVTAVVPSWAHFGHGWIWLSVIGAVALWAFTGGWQQHQNKSVVVFFILGYSNLVVVTLLEGRVSAWVESAFFVLGGSLMVLAHWRNYRLMQCIRVTDQ